MKLLRVLLIAVLLISAVALPFLIWTPEGEPEVYFGVSYGQRTVAEARQLIDKVRGYTNLFLINNWDIATNETVLNEIADYAASADLHFMVFFSFISNQTYAWHQTWLDSAKQRWGDKFLGVYLYDEPGGNQIELGQWNRGGTVKKLYENTSSPAEAAEKFVSLGTSPLYNSMNDLKRRGIPAFTSDFALYWYDYMAGYSTVFAELGWNHSTRQQIALCRGAADSFGKDWGAIITWTYTQPPYIASGPQIRQDMQTAYNAGAKYISVFNYANETTGNIYSILKEEHFAAMQQFWNHIKEHPREGYPGVEAVLVLPENYGGGLRRADDNVWGPTTLPWRAAWPEDTQTPHIWENLNRLSESYGLSLNVIFDGKETTNLVECYNKVYFWNQTFP